jgi:hypothetical protein
MKCRQNEDGKRNYGQQCSASYRKGPTPPQNWYKSGSDSPANFLASAHRPIRFEPQSGFLL